MIVGKLAEDLKGPEIENGISLQLNAINRQWKSRKHLSVDERRN
ncbi:MAG TPA: hypothetical protein VEK32_19160 [Thermodesulfobacteriota bacterium]|nr:hypothetical protein [Thermodesulfobacteriota bacterium]